MSEHLQHTASGDDDPSAGSAQIPNPSADAMRVSSDLYYDEPRVMLIGSKGVHLLTKGQQILFSTLLRAGGAPVSAQTLAMRLAGDSLVPRQVKTVRNAISRLRRDLAKITPTVRVANRYAIGYYIHVDSPAPRDA